MAYGRLDVFWPEGKIESFLLEGDTVSVGRAGGNTIALDTDTISRYHFSIMHQNGRVTITDLDSANGTFVDGVRLNSNEPHELDGVEEIVIGHLRMIFHPVDESPTLPMALTDEDTQRVESATAHFRIELDTNRIDVWPASNSTVELYITNLSDKTERYIVRAEGLPSEWIRINRPEVEIDPDESAQILVNIKPVRRSDATPGEFVLRLDVNPKSQSDALVSGKVTVRVHSFNGFGMALATNKIGLKDEIALFVLNQGSAPLPIHVRGIEKSGTLAFAFASGAITLAPGQRAQINGRIKAQKRPLIGASQEVSAALVVQSGDAAHWVAMTDLFVTIPPLLPVWALLTVVGVLGSFFVLVLMLLGGAFARPEPNISAFTAGGLQVIEGTPYIGQGTPLALGWSATDVSGFTLFINGTPLPATLGPDAREISLNTSDLEGNTIVMLEGSYGDKRDTAAQIVRVYPPLNPQTWTFVIEPTTLYRNVVTNLTLRWEVPDARQTELIGLGQFTNAQVPTTHGATGVLSDIAGIPSDTFTITLRAYDIGGNITETSRTVSVIIPQCGPATADVPLRAGPDSAHQVVGLLPINANQEVVARSADANWIQFRLQGGVFGWALRSDLTCAEGFDPAQLRTEINVPPTPTLSPTATATITPSPLPTRTSPTPIGR